MIQNLIKRSRVSIVFGALFLFLNCSSQTPQIWLLRDIQSLDAKVMNTIQWLKIEKSNYKFLNKALKNKLELYRKTNFIVYQKIEKEIEIIDKNLKEVEAYLTKQKKIEILEISSLGIDINNRLQILEVNEPPERKPGIKVEDVNILVEKLKNEAKVL